MKCPLCNGKLMVRESRTNTEHLTGKLKLVARKHGLLELGENAAWCVRERKCAGCARVSYTVEEMV